MGSRSGTPFGGRSGKVFSTLVDFLSNSQVKNILK